MNEHVAPPTGAPEPIPGSAAPLDIAMATEAQDPALESPARLVLRRHAELLEQQLRQGGMALVRDRIKVWRDLSLVGLVLLVVAGAGWALWDASRADGVVVERFTVPPDLASQGLAGEVVANRLLDHMTEMHATLPSWGTPGTRARGSRDELRVEIPQSGVSLGELTRHLRRTLGRERTVTGEVWRRGQRLVVSARLSGSPSDLVQGDATDPDTAVRALAERLFHRLEPVRYGDYLLVRSERLPPAERRMAEDRALAVYRAAAQAGGSDQSRAYSNWGDILHNRGDPRGLELLKIATRINPDLGHLHANLARAYAQLGESHLVLHHSVIAGAGFERESRGRNLRNARYGAAAMRNYVRRVTGAHADGAAESCARADRGVEPEWNRVVCARSLAEGHDALRARERLAQLPADHSERLLLMSYVEEGQGEWNTALELREAYDRRRTAEGDGARLASNVWPRTAILLARAGRAAEAAALAARTPGCYECFRARGWAAAASGDAVGAEQWFARAVRRGPKVPWAYADQAETRLMRGDGEGARRAALQAQRHGPRWPDAHKLEGDALAQLGRRQRAIAAYREAAERAPRWGALHLAWGRSLQALGREEQARVKYAEASRLGLSAADRALVQRLLRSP